jgi:hypothetical protein
MPRWGFDDIFDFPVDILVSNGSKRWAIRASQLSRVRNSKEIASKSILRVESTNPESIKICEQLLLGRTQVVIFQLM